MAIFLLLKFLPTLLDKLLDVPGATISRFPWSHDLTWLHVMTGHETKQHYFHWLTLQTVTTQLAGQTLCNVWNTLGAIEVANIIHIFAKRVEDGRENSLLLLVSVSASYVGIFQFRPFQVNLRPAFRSVHLFAAFCCRSRDKLHEKLLSVLGLGRVLTFSLRNVSFCAFYFLGL